MHLIFFNFSWMSFNIFLASIPVVFGWLMYRAKTNQLKLFYGFIWLIFFPNSIYLFTDVINLINQWGGVNQFERTVFLFQYSTLLILGLITFVLSLYLFERTFTDFSRSNKNAVNIIVFINFVTGFGLTLGRVERVNSWDVLFAPQKILSSSANIFLSIQLFFLTILFGIFANLLYFLFKKPIVKYVNTYLSRVDV